MPNDQELADRLDELGIIDPGEPIFGMSNYKLRRNFGYLTEPGVDKSVLVRSLIWQDYLLLEDDQLDPFTGNIRSYWYARVKPVLARAQARGRDDYYGRMIAHFVTMAVDYRLFPYRAFGFVDHGRHNRRIGVSHPHIILAAEKVGHMLLLDRLHREYDITVIALGGQPSALSMEYLVDELLGAGVELDQRLVVFTFVDFDPAGAEITREFLEKLGQNGMSGDIVCIDLMDPADLTLDELKLNRFTLARRGSARTKADRWLEETGGLRPYGITRGRFGIEADSMPWDRVVDKFTAEVQPYLDVPVEMIRRYNLIEEMVGVLQRLLVERLLG